MKRVPKKWERIDKNSFDQVVTVSDEDAVQMTKDLARREGLLCGISSGANVFVAANLASRMAENQNVVTIICDTGERYLSTGIYD